MDDDLSRRYQFERLYHSGDGFVTTVWGPLIWHFLHIVSMNFPVHPTREDKLKYFRFIQSLGDVLPCGPCRNNFVKNIKQSGFGIHVLSSRFEFSKWMYNFHNIVNIMLGKPRYSRSFSDTMNMYEYFRAGGCKYHHHHHHYGNNTFSFDDSQTSSASSSASSSSSSLLYNNNIPPENGCTQSVLGNHMKPKCVIKLVFGNEKKKKIY